LHWRSLGPERADDLLAFVEGPTVAAEQGSHGLATGRSDEPCVGGHVVGGGLGELPIEAEHLLGPAQGIGHHPSQNRRADGVELILERGDDAEVAAAAAQAPEEVLVLRGAGRQEPAVGSDHIRRDEIIDGQPVLAGQPAEAAAEGEAGDAGVGVGATGGGEAEGQGLVVDLDPLDPCLCPGGAHSEVDTDGLHGR
jgi:hypothetical protein